MGNKLGPFATENDLALAKEFVRGMLAVGGRSAAAANAFDAAGIKLNRSFSGTGETQAAMEALGRHICGDNYLTTLEVYG